MRVFIAIEIPEEIRAKITHFSEILQRSGLVQGNFVDKGNIHLTLKFFENVSEEEVEKMKIILSGLKLKPFPLNLENLGFFPNEDYVKLMWIGANSDEVKEMQAMIEEALFKEGFPKDKKGFHTHITLARIKKITDKQTFREKVQKAHLQNLDFNVKSFSLIKSELTPTGPKYKKLAEFKL